MGSQTGTMFPVVIVFFSGEGHIQGVWHLRQLDDRRAVSLHAKGMDTQVPDWPGGGSMPLANI